MKPNQINCFVWTVVFYALLILLAVGVAVSFSYSFLNKEYDSITHINVSETFVRLLTHITDSWRVEGRCGLWARYPGIVSTIPVFHTTVIIQIPMRVLTCYRLSRLSRNVVVSLHRIVSCCVGHGIQAIVIRIWCLYSE